MKENNEFMWLLLVSGRRLTVVLKFKIAGQPSTIWSGKKKSIEIWSTMNLKTNLVSFSY
jgi:hypothetical protein